MDSVYLTKYGIYEKSSELVKDEYGVICVKRLSGYNFYKSPKTSGGCSSGMKECGGVADGKISGDLSTYCVPKDSKCPITHIGWATNKAKYLYPANAESAGKFFHVYGEDLGEIFFTRNSPGYMLSEFTISEGKLPCLKHTDYNLDKRKKYELYDEFSYKFGNCDVDGRWATLGTPMIEKTFYELNGLGYLEDDLPGFRFSTSVDFNIFFRKYVHLDFRCRDDYELFSKSKDNLDAINSSLAALLSFSIIFSLCLLCVETWTPFCYGSKKWWGVLVKRLYKKKKGSKTCFFIYKVI